MVDNVEHGIWTIHHYNSDFIVVHSAWQQGEPHGTWIYRDKQGNILERNTFEDGR